MSNTISPQDLRIGNYIEFQETGQYVKVTEIMEDGFSVMFPDDEHTWIEADQFGPIELTEEILVKAGFKSHRMKRIHYCKESGVFEMMMDSHSNYRLFTGGGTEGVPIQYLHQLQNLFYSLTGRELEIKI